MNETTDATAILAPIWRRKWLILVVAILVAAGSYFYYKRQSALFQSTTQLYLAAGAEEQFTEKAAGKSATANAGNQAALINSIIVESVKRQLRKEHDRIAKTAARGKVRAKSAEKSQFITVNAEAHGAKPSALLANAVAKSYIRRQHAQYVHGIKGAIAIARRQLRKLETPRFSSAAAKGRSASASNVIQSATLSSKINQLEAQLAVVAVEQVKPAKSHAAVLLSPHPRKNAIFGFVIGLVLASIAAFTLSRFNRRLRSVADVETVLQTQILTALPRVGRPIVNRDGQLAPSKPLIEPLRRLHTTLQLERAVEHDHHGLPRSILFLSADAGDGKSTLIANLALAHREAGEHVAIVEADFRRPVQAKLLGVDGSRGLADVLTGTLTVGDAMQTVASVQTQALAGQEQGGAGAGVAATALASRASGELAVLAGGPAVANPPALLASEGMREVLRMVAGHYDRVLIDAPSPLEVSDVMPLLGAVDAIVIVARIAYTRETSARRLQQLLMSTPSAPLLGAVANGVARGDIEKYGISSGRDERGLLAKLVRR